MYFFSSNSTTTNNVGFAFFQIALCVLLKIMILKQHEQKISIYFNNIINYIWNNYNTYIYIQIEEEIKTSKLISIVKYNFKIPKEPKCAFTIISLKTQINSHVCTHTSNNKKFETKRERYGYVIIKKMIGEWHVMHLIVHGLEFLSRLEWVIRKRCKSDTVAPSSFSISHCSSELKFLPHSFFYIYKYICDCKISY